MNCWYFVNGCKKCTYFVWAADVSSSFFSNSNVSFHVSDFFYYIYNSLYIFLFPTCQYFAFNQQISKFYKYFPYSNIFKLYMKLNEYSWNCHSLDALVWDTYLLIYWNTSCTRHTSSALCQRCNGCNGCNLQHGFFLHLAFPEWGHDSSQRGIRSLTSLLLYCSVYTERRTKIDCEENGRKEISTA